GRALPAPRQGLQRDARARRPQLQGGDGGGAEGGHDACAGNAARAARSRARLTTTMAAFPHAWTADAVRALVEPDRVHRDLYIDPELFALEQEHFFAN